VMIILDAVARYNAARGDQSTRGAGAATRA